MKKKVFQLTPLGRADKEVRDFLRDELNEEELKSYESGLDKFRSAKTIHLIVKSLLYAGLIASVAATFGLPQAYILQKIASYIGVTLLFVIYGFSKYFMEFYREHYHVQREIVISKAAERNGGN
ncbi:hypothetical protein GKQ38_05035 [Candidatus Nanohaloarchaea archaeon]|nr:hypothetical protein GKQ38_05035 [Candidatus Nanohaloarchaea archaeon]